MVWGNLGCRIACDESSRLYIQLGQFFEAIGLDANICFLTYAKDNAVLEFGLEYVVSVKSVGTKLAEILFDDHLAGRSPLHQYQGRRLAFEADLN